MPASRGPSGIDRRVRLNIYRRTIASGRIPTVAETAKRLHRTAREIRAAHRNLAAGHAIVLHKGSNEILRAAPFWAVPTAFPVDVARRSYWASCIWDALGIPVMLNKDAQILAACGCCDQPIVLEVKRGSLAKARAIIHFAVPARHWYDDIVFT